jgi:tetratricopeptide (TPR) repeat protein
MRLVITCAVAWPSMLAPGPLLAAPAGAKAEPAAEEPPEPNPQDEQIERAMAAYQRGTQSYNLAQYEVALADFTEAASLYASPDFQYNIGLCYEKLGKYEDAIRAFAAYLRAKPDAEDRVDVENRIHMLEQEQQERKRQAEADERARADAAARPQPQPQVVPTTDEPPRNEAERPLIIAGAALAGVGAAVALGGGIALGVLARQRSQAVDEVQTGGNPEGLTLSETQEIEDEGKRFEGIQIGMVAGGAAVAVTGAVLLALGLRKREAARTQAWRLGPLYSRGSSAAGLVLTGRF